MRLPPVASLALLLGFVPAAAAAGLDPGRVPQLVKALTGENAEERLKAARDLGDLGKPAAPGAAALRKAVATDKHPGVRARAARALAQIGTPALPELLTLLEQDDSATRRLALQALARMGPDARDAVPALRTALHDRVPANRALAALALGEVGLDARAAIEDLVAALGGPEVVRKGAIRALARFGQPAVPALCNGLRNRDSVLRARSAHVLALLGTAARDAVPALVAALEDRERPVRLLATAALGAIGPKAAAAVPALVERLADKNRAQRQAATHALARIGAPTVPALVKVLQGNGKTDRLHALIAVREIGPAARAAVPALRDLLTDRDVTLRRLATLTLGQIGPAAAAAVPDLTARADDSDARVRLGAALALAQIQPNDPRPLRRLNREIDRTASPPTPALLAALDPVRQARVQAYLDTFILAASFNFGDGLKPEAHFLMDQLGPDAIPTMVRTLNKLSVDPTGKEPILDVKPAPFGTTVIGERTFYFI